MVVGHFVLLSLVLMLFLAKQNSDGPKIVFKILPDNTVC